MGGKKEQGAKKEEDTRGQLPNYTTRHRARSKERYSAQRKIKAPKQKCQYDNFKKNYLEASHNKAGNL